jgi:TPP-dependent pyruvate/acetoin dehydrogenase alpha subunit
MSRHIAVASLNDLETQVDLLRSMVQIRHFEEACHRLFAEGVVRGTTHLGQGQEAVSVGACRALRAGDTMTCTYRGHAAVLAMGASMERAFAELLGKAGGLCGGKGGSMHLTDVSCGAIGSFAIVGAHLPVTVGAAFAARYRDSGAVSLCFFGDGSSNIGAFHESLNLASVWRLPAIFVCENNLYGEYSPLASTTSITRLADRADAYEMAKATVDGNDVGAMYTATTDAITRAVAGEGPTLLEALTYRHKGHSRSDPASYRPDGELERWLERDPIRMQERSLLESGVEQARLDAVQQAAETSVAEALEHARSGADPHPESRLEHVFT